MSNVDPLHSVLAFSQALISIRSLVQRELGGQSSLFDLVAQAKKNTLKRSGTLADDTEYFVHGIGCRFISSHGEEVDVDVLPDGREIFDTWRIESFVRSLRWDIGDTSILADACDELVRQGKLGEVKRGWYYLTG